MEEINEMSASEIKQLTHGLVDDIAISATQLNNANDRYKALMEKAAKAKEQKIGIFSGKKVAIETLQEVALDHANMINELWVWHNKSLDHLKKLTESVQKLVFISTTSAAFTRAIIQELKNKTNGPLTEAARKQLINVIRDLERQADVHDKVNRMRNDVIDLKRDNLSHKDAVALIMGALEEKYDRRQAESHIADFSTKICDVSNSIKNMDYRFTIWKFIIIGAVLLSAVSLFMNLL